MPLLIHNISGGMYLLFNAYTRIIVVGVFNVLFILLVLKKSAFLKQKWLFYLGSISYPLYLIHQSIGSSVIIFLSKFVNESVACAVGIVLSIGIATVITYLFEKPVHKWIKSKFKNKEVADIQNKEVVDIQITNQ